MTIAIDSSPQAKAKRLKMLRAMIDKTREEIASDYNISVNTQRMWETPPKNSNGLTEKGAKRIIKAIRKDGVICSLDWLLNGIGNGPKTIDEVDEKILAPIDKVLSVPEVDWGESEILVKEQEFFKEMHQNATVMRVHDDGMSPYLNPNDYVGGEKCIDNQINKLIGTICIVELEDGRQLCRRLDKKLSDEYKHYTLTCINPIPSQAYPMSNVKVISAAEVIWIRKMKNRES